jgi:hypothetical protein
MQVGGVLPRLCGLAGDAEPVSDLGPGVALGAQVLDRLGDGVVQLVCEPGHEAECVDVAVCDAAAVGAQDELTVPSFSTSRRGRFGDNLVLSSDRLPLPVGWSAMRGSSACSFRPDRNRGDRLGAFTR